MSVLNVFPSPDGLLVAVHTPGRQRTHKPHLSRATPAIECKRRTIPIKLAWAELPAHYPADSSEEAV